MFPSQGGGGGVPQGQGRVGQAPPPTKRKTAQFGSALFYKKGRRRNTPGGAGAGGAYGSSAGGDSSNFKPESRLGRFIYAVDCCRTRRRATISSVICATLIAIAIALAIYFTYNKQRPIPQPIPIASNNATTQSGGGGGVIIPPNFPTMAPVLSNETGSIPTPPPISIPTLPPVPLGPCDLRCRLDIIQVFLRQALQERRLNFPLQDVRTNDDGGFVNTPQTQAMLFLANQDPDPLLNFDIIPRTSPSALSNFFATSNISPQTFRLAVTKFGLATLFYELNSNGLSSLSWLNDSVGGGSVNVCDWEGITCEIDSTSGFGTTASVNSGVTNSGFGFGSTTTTTTDPTQTSSSETLGDTNDYYGSSAQTPPIDNYYVPNTYYNPSSGSNADGISNVPPIPGAAATTRNNDLDAEMLLAEEGHYRHRESKYDHVDENDGNDRRLRRGNLRQADSSFTSRLLDQLNEEEEEEAQLLSSSWIVRYPRGGEEGNKANDLLKNHGQMISLQREQEKKQRGRRRRVQDTTNSNAPTVNSQIDPFVISEIRLPQRNLTGSIGVALNLFGQTLQILDLSRNSIGGPLPNELFSQQTNLRELHLYSNDLTGTIDGSFLGLAPTTLEEIYLDDNDLVGSVPTQLGLLSNLKRIDLFGNNFFDTIPTQIGQLTQLETLWLSDNSMGGTLPTELCQLTSLQNLYLDFNFFFGTIPECLPPAIQSTAIDIRMNHNLLSGDLSTSATSDFSLMSQLRILDLDENDFSGTLPDTWSNITTIENLAVASNRLTGPLPESYSNLTQLKVLNISRNVFDGGSIPQSYVTNFQNLERILASEISLNNIPDLSSLENLRSIDFGSNAIQPSPMPQWLTQVSTTLEELRLNSNGWQGPIVDMSHLTNIKVLTLQGNSLNGNLPEWIGTNLRQLEILNLRNNFFTGFVPQSFENLINIQRLDLSGNTNQLFGQIPDQVCQAITTRTEDIDIIINCATLQCPTLQCPTQQYPNCCTCSS